MTTIDDVAKRAGVSKSSVSRVLNSNFEYMKEETKEKVLRAMEELEFVPNQVAQSLKRKATKTIGIIISDISNPFLAEVLKGVQAECTKSGYSLMVSTSSEEPKIERDNILNLKNRQVDGLIINTAGQNSKLFNDLLEEDYPLVFLDRFADEMKADTVVVNNLFGARKSIEYLIREGHERIGILLYPVKDKSPRIDRLEGYKQALSEAGIRIDEELIKICDEEKGGGVQATKQLLSLENRPTAIFSTNTILNLEALMGVKESALSVPRDLSLIGYDDYPWVPLLDPPLSTVAQPAYEMGANATLLLIERLKGKSNQTPKIIQLNPELIIRESCSPPTMVQLITSEQKM